MTSLEEQVQTYRELVKQIADLEEKKRELNQEICRQMLGKTIVVSGYIVRRYERFSFRTSIEKARELGATKTEEVLDKKVLKSLHESGQLVPGGAVYSYVQVLAQKDVESSSLDTTD